MNGPGATSAADEERPPLPRPTDRLRLLLTVALSDTGRDGQNLERMLLLFATMNRFFSGDLCHMFFIMMCPVDLAISAAAVEPYGHRLKIELINEEDVCPELRTNPDTTSLWPKVNSGWYRQQLIKLAMHEHVPTPFYMTLNTDVLFVRPVQEALVFDAARARLNVQTAKYFRSLYTPEMVAIEVEARLGRKR